MPATSQPGRSVSSRLLEVMFSFRAGWQLGTLAPMTEPLRSVALPFMEDLYTAQRQHVQLAVMEDGEAVVVERLSRPGAVGLASRVGGALPLHCSAVGKVLLAHGDRHLFDGLVAEGLRAYTAATVTDADRLRRELAHCRRTGTAVVREEMSAGADSVAARVINREGEVVAGLSVVVRSGSVSLTALVPSVVTSALGISRRLGWTPGVGVRRCDGGDGLTRRSGSIGPVGGQA